MGEVNRFRPLKTIGNMTYKVKQSRFDATLVGEGTCAAASMQWLQYTLNPGSPAMNIQDIAELQRTYDNIRASRNNTVALLVLARALLLNPSEPFGPPAGAPLNEWWLEQGFGASFSEQIVRVVEKLREDLAPNSRRGAYLGFSIVLVSIAGHPRNKVLELARNDPTAPPWLRNWKDPGHAVALAVDETKISFCDANCGIYEVAPDRAGDFFTQLEDSYAAFMNAPSRPPIVMEPRLYGIVPVDKGE